MDIKLVSPPEAHYTVYRLTDPAGKIYIGCTGQTVKRRWRSGAGYKSNTPVGRAISALGWNSIRKDILCEKLTKEGAEKLEKWFVEYYDSMNPEKGYNRITGGARKGARVSAEAKALNRESQLSAYSNPECCRMVSERKLAYYRRHPEARRRIAMQVSEYLRSPAGRKFVECCSKPKPVRCVETGEVYPSQKAAEDKTGFCNIHKVCAGKKSVCGGYHWEYVN